MNVTILDYGAGNVTSVEHALQRLGVASTRGSAPEPIARAEALLLPGVGHYATLIRALEQLSRFGTTVLIATSNLALTGRSQHPRIHLEAGRLTGPENGPA